MIYMHLKVSEYLAIISLANIFIHHKDALLRLLMVIVVSQIMPWTSVIIPNDLTAKCSDWPIRI